MLSLHHLACISTLILPLLRPVLATQDLPWPSNVPPHIRPSAENGLGRRDVDIEERLQRERIIGVHKLDADPAQKFYLEYWAFENDGQQMPVVSSNTSHRSDYLPAVPLHRNQSSGAFALLPRHLALFLEPRAFTCPSGTESCASIDQPNICCPAGSTCQTVPDTGLGSVGCCEASQICAGSLSECPADYTSCPDNPGGGCCLPGYACFAEGCVQTSTTVVVVTPSSTSTSSPSTSTTIVIITPTPSTTESPSSSPASSSAVTRTSTTPRSSTLRASSALVCSTAYRSCPASLGGGCCPTDRACGSPVCPELTSSASVAPPVRPTTDSATSSSIVAGCPTGFYACSAYYEGGCCQIGRNCAKTNCPTTGSTTVVGTLGVTAVAPTGAYLPTTTSLLTGNCATGWSTCAASVGGGCCPAGYGCGTAICSATASGASGNAGKMVPSGAANLDVRLAWTVMSVLSILSLFLMVVL